MQFTDEHELEFRSLDGSIGGGGAIDSAEKKSPAAERDRCPGLPADWSRGISGEGPPAQEGDPSAFSDPREPARTHPRRDLVNDLSPG